jgi:hypothetical protein
MSMDRTSDDETFAALRAMWRQADPVPADLDGSVLALIDAELITSDVALLELIDEHTRAATVRGAGDERTLRFSDGTREVLIRIVPGPHGARIDGWSVPTVDGAVTLRCDGRRHETSAMTAGRFAFNGVPDGAATLWFEVGGAPSAGWKAGPFTI